MCKHKNNKSSRQTGGIVGTMQNYCSVFEENPVELTARRLQRAARALHHDLSFEEAIAAAKRQLGVAAPEATPERVVVQASACVATNGVGTKIVRQRKTGVPVVNLSTGRAARAALMQSVVTTRRRLSTLSL